MSAVTHLLLDVDGVLVTGRPEDGLPWATDLKRDTGIDPADLAQVFFDKHWRDVVIGKADLLPCLEDALQSLQADMEAMALVDYWFSNDARLNHDLLAFSDDMRARGMAVFLATNQDHLRADYLMSTLGLAAHIDGMFHSAGLGVKKPDRAFFEAIEARTGAAPSAHLFVDDSVANVEAARTMGWCALQWNGAGDLHVLRDALA